MTYFSRGYLNTLILVVALSGPADAVAQSMQCGAAVQQLQNYVQQVNYYANSEYFQGIPMKCGWDQGCRYNWLERLNQWYSQQTYLVNGWYGQIMSQCNNVAVQRPGAALNPIQSGQPPSMNTDDIETLTARNAGRTLRIEIPNNPQGYR